jgi:hypothetical protein
MSNPRTVSSPNRVIDQRCLAHIVRACLLSSVLALGLPGLTRHASAQTIPGLDSWADATVGTSTRKWVGPRVPFPVPTPRPASHGRIDSLLFPLSVHLAAGVSAERGLGVLAALEEVYPVLSAAGWAPTFGDGGQAGTGSHDVYVVPTAAHGAGAAIDASEPFGSFDSARAFALVDARVPSSHVAVCATEALLQAFLYELDPAEAESVRRASAAYVAYLAQGVAGCDDDFSRGLAQPREAPFGEAESARGALWLMRLSAREDRQSGTFLRNMWDFARQRTWEGRDLRASPDLLECVAQAVVLRREIFEELAASLSEQHYLLPAPFGVAPEKPRVLSWNDLPRHVWQAEPTIGPLGAMHAWVKLEKPRPGEQLRVWSRGELGVRWALLVTRLDAHGNEKGSMRGAVRKNPNGFLVIELDDATTDVLITLTNVGDGTPDADDDESFFDHGAELIVARGNPGGTMPGTTDDPP